MRMARWLLGTAGLVACGYAVAGAARDPDVSPGGVLVFLGAVLLAHDAVVLPLAIGVGALAGRAAPGRARAGVHGALFATAVVLVIGLPLALGYGRAADNPSALPRDYARGLSAVLAVVWLAAGAAVVAGRLAAGAGRGAGSVSTRPKVGRSARMREDNYPEPVSDPEAEGLPGTADDDSTAYDDVDSPRVADGPDPAALPGGLPLAVDRYGTTAAEARLGEPLDYRLAQEEPDVGVDDRSGHPDDVDLVDDVTDRPDPDAGLFDAGVPAYDGEVSEYDTLDPALDRIGRLVEPDEGAHSDTEPDAVAYDAGAAGGGATAEELAMHEVVENE